MHGAFANAPLQESPVILEVLEAGTPLISLAIQQYNQQLSTLLGITVQRKLQSQLIRTLIVEGQNTGVIMIGAEAARAGTTFVV